MDLIWRGVVKLAMGPEIIGGHCGEIGAHSLKSMRAIVSCRGCEVEVSSIAEWK